ncbi:MAG: UDP-N-acetylmuramoyl-L-alanyl-D-glutamate--2,6-diaminopimelate ligase [Candidatus Sericytochromatia bacterium]|nr:UDP-N-acetylmuramoyl-L-alanyl-D-glutamate--2,6-diaminopimelate ligase [Candidatus Tanganyikabacteria bacterium]
MRLTDLISRYPQASAFPDAEIGGIAYDSRQVRPGYLFVAVPGTRVDGHDFVGAALDAGAAAALVARDRVAALPPGNYLVAADTREALAHASAAFWDFPGRRLRAVGVTGTNGKTTTTHLVEAAMLACGWPAGVIGTLGARYTSRHLVTTVDLGFTTPQAPETQQLLAMMADAGVRGVAMEVSSHALDQHRAGCIDFGVGVFTNLTRDHLDYHGTEDAYAAAKARLFASLRPDGWAIVNADDPRGDQMLAAGPARRLTYGLSNPADVTLRDLALGPAGSSGTLITPDGERSFRLSLPGRFNVYNALAAIATCRALDLDPERTLEAIARVPGVPGRVERVTSPEHPFAVMVDYAHTPDGLENVLRAARDFTRGRLIAVFGCGGDRDRTKRPIMGRLASDLADLAVVTSDNPRTEDPHVIIAEIRAGMTGEYKVLPDRAEAIRFAVREARPGDTVLLAGKGHEPYQIVGTRRLAFDDREVAKLALRELAAEGRQDAGAAR